MDLKNIIAPAAGALKEHAPGIMTGIGIFGMAASVGLAVWQTPKADILLQQKKQEKQQAGQEPKVTAMETVKAVWKPYLPSLLTFAASAGLLIGSGHIAGVRTATMATALGLSETAFREYKTQVVKSLGEKKEGLIQDEVAKEKIAAHPVKDQQVIITGGGETLCYDSISGRYFKSCMEKLKRAENEINRRLLGEMYISLNEFYDEIGLKNVDCGDVLGWNTSGGFMEIRYTSTLTEEGTPVLVMNYAVMPVSGYDKLY